MRGNSHVRFLEGLGARKGPWPTRRHTPMLHETLNFIRRHWPHLLLVVPGAIVVTILHESAHAIAVLLQGGTLSRFVWLPSAGKWGYISYNFPDGTTHSTLSIILAPYCLWLLLALLTSLVSFRLQKVVYWKASFLYFWSFVVPLADIANTAFPYLAGKRNDFRAAFGQPSVFAGAIISLFCVLTVIGGYYVQRRLYREDRLSASSYLALSSIVLVIIVMLTVWKPLI
jgi:hypothetical protein